MDKRVAVNPWHPPPCSYPERLLPENGWWNPMGHDVKDVRIAQVHFAAT